MPNAVFIAQTLDGYIARKDHSIDFLDRMQVDGEDYGFAAFFAGVDVVVIGRGTYDVVVAFPEWPYAGKRVVVLTNQQRDAKHGEEFFAGDVNDLELRNADGSDAVVYVDGGNVIRQFLNAGRIDTMVVSVLPILLGEGLPLFGEGVEHALTLTSSQAYPSGLVQLRYALDA